MVLAPLLFFSYLRRKQQSEGAVSPVLRLRRAGGKVTSNKKVSDWAGLVRGWMRPCDGEARLPPALRTKYTWASALPLADHFCLSDQAPDETPIIEIIFRLYELC